MGLTSMAMCTCRPRAGAWQWSESPQACNCQLVVASCRHTCTSSVILFKKRTLQKKEPYSRQGLSVPSAGMPVASYECQSFTIRVTRASTSRIIWRKLIARIPHRATATRATTRAGQLVVYSFSYCNTTTGYIYSTRSTRENRVGGGEATFIIANCYLLALTRHDDSARQGGGRPPPTGTATAGTRRSTGCRTGRRKPCWPTTDHELLGSMAA